MILRLTFGIDPGLTGAVATLIDGDAGPLFDIPTTRVDGKREVNAAELAAWIRGQRMEHRGAYVSACMERVGSVPVQGRKQGGVSMFQFGDGNGQLKATLAILGIPYVRVMPQVWKRHMGLIGTEKDDARLLAIRRFPNVAEQLQRKKDQGRADALLIALWHESTQMRGAKAA